MFTDTLQIKNAQIARLNFKHANVTKATSNIHINYLAKARTLYQVVKKQKSGVYNLGLHQGFNVEDIANLVEKVSGHKFHRERKPKRPFDINEIVVDSTKAQQDLDWHPITSIEDGIKQQYEFMVKNQGEVK